MSTRTRIHSEGHDPQSAVAAFSPEPKDVSVAGSPPPGTARTERPSPVEAPVSTWRPPAVVGRYRIENILGCGGMGQVYRAWDAELQRYVAMKFILGIEPDATARERFMVEARATARLQHPNVLTIHDVHELDGRPYLVMEYLSGKTLEKVAKPMCWSRGLELGIALSSGLAAAHRHGVLHRDIKPDNAMLTDEGQVKLLDFGLAKVATRLSSPHMVLKQESVQTSPPSAAATLRTRTDVEEARPAPTLGNIVGTPGYMAPESWRGYATPRSDVYSLGALLFELCAGRAPYADVAPHRLSFTVQERDAPRLTDVVPTADPMFATIIARCLSRDPDARYASGEELHEALKQLERPIPAGDPHRRGLPSSRSRTKRRGPRSRKATTAARMVFREVGALVVSVHAPETPTDGDWNAYLQLCRRKMARERIGVLVVTAGGGPTPDQRPAIRELLEDGPVLTAVVMDAPMVQGTIAILGWLNPGIRSFSGATGLDDALRYLGLDVPTAERVLLEVRAMQRELA
jgi:serine/threonine protein kinase